MCSMSGYRLHFSDDRCSLGCATSTRYQIVKSEPKTEITRWGVRYFLSKMTIGLVFKKTYFFNLIKTSQMVEISKASRCACVRIRVCYEL